MGKFIAGMLLVILAASIAGPARAAEIPPTAECTKTYSKLVKRFWEEAAQDESKAGMNRANRKLVRELFDAGCVSATKPLVKWLPAKPFSKQCVSAAKATDNFLKPLSRRIQGMTNRYEARSKRLTKRTKALGKRIRRLKENGASRKRIRRLSNRQFRLFMKSGELALDYFERMTGAVGPRADATTLILLELVSLRCLGENSFAAVLDEKYEAKGPVARALRKHQVVVIFSLFYSMFGGIDGAEAGEPVQVSSSSAQGPPLGDGLPILPAGSPGIAGLASIRPE